LEIIGRSNSRIIENIAQLRTIWLGDIDMYHILVTDYRLRAFIIRSGAPLGEVQKIGKHDIAPGGN
jgi:hypothetical protein